MILCLCACPAAVCGMLTVATGHKNIDQPGSTVAWQHIYAQATSCRSLNHNHTTQHISRLGRNCLHVTRPCMQLEQHCSGPPHVCA